MWYYACISKDSFEIKEITFHDGLNLDTVRKLLKEHNGDTEWIEAVYQQFRNQNTVLLVDETGALKDLPILALTTRGTRIRGAFVIAGKRFVDFETGYDLCGITIAEIRQALNELLLVRYIDV